MEVQGLLGPASSVKPRPKNQPAEGGPCDVEGVSQDERLAGVPIFDPCPSASLNQA